MLPCSHTGVVLSKEAHEMEDDQYYKLLVQRFSDRTATDEELEVFIKLANEGKLDGYLNQAMNKDAGITEQDENNFHAPTKVRSFWPRIAAAASILICLGIGVYFYRGNHKQQPDQSIALNNFKPGANRAILTLAGGKQILLTGAANGRLALQGSTVINKTSNGEVVYNSGEPSNSGTIYNTMSTPMGGQYHLVLADGTGVWLNAGSTIKYPTAFNGKVRKVEITGEVYFEVAHNKAKPFLVVSNGQMVKVLGTQFNINAYDNEKSIKTTLLKGSVEVTANGSQKILKPGQQSTSSQTGISLSEVDPDEVVAWKDGYFDFSETDIKTIMRQFSRWYDVDIQFDGPTTTETFTGRIPRNWTLSQVIKIVQSSKSVRLTVEGRRIIVKQ